MAKQITKEDVQQIQQNWMNYVTAGDLQSLLSLYREDAILKPTLSAKIRTNIPEIQDYFSRTNDKGEREGFLHLEIQEVKITENHIRLHNNIAISVGKYEFFPKNQDVLQAGFTWTFEKSEQIKIISHHSSLRYQD